jgi:hypothetical protein
LISTVPSDVKNGSTLTRSLRRCLKLGAHGFDRARDDEFGAPGKTILVIGLAPCRIVRPSVADYAALLLEPAQSVLARHDPLARIVDHPRHADVAARLSGSLARDDPRAHSLSELEAGARSAITSERIAEPLQRDAPARSVRRPRLERVREGRAAEAPAPCRPVGYPVGTGGCATVRWAAGVCGSARRFGASAGDLLQKPRPNRAPAAMVRKGSPVRVRQRASQTARQRGFLDSGAACVTTSCVREGVRRFESDNEGRRTRGRAGRCLRSHAGLDRALPRTRYPVDTVPSRPGPWPDGRGSPGATRLGELAERA